MIEFTLDFRILMSKNNNRNLKFSLTKIEIFYNLTLNKLIEYFDS